MIIYLYQVIEGFLSYLCQFIPTRKLKIIRNNTKNKAQGVEVDVDFVMTWRVYLFPHLQFHYN